MLFREMAYSRDGQGKHKMSLEHLTVPESEDVLKKQKAGDMSKGHKIQPERAFNGQSWNNRRKNK